GLRAPAGVPAGGLVPVRPAVPARRAFRHSRPGRGRTREGPVSRLPPTSTAIAAIRTAVGGPQRGPDPLRIVRVGRGHADRRPGSGYRRRTGPRGPDRQAGVAAGIEAQTPPPLLPLGYVSVAGPDVSGQNRQGGQGGPALRFLE